MFGLASIAGTHGTGCNSHVVDSDLVKREGNISC
jgi:hypothetical protein